MHKVVVLDPEQEGSLSDLNALLEDRWQVLGAVVVRESVIYTLGRGCDHCGADLDDDEDFEDNFDEDDFDDGGLGDDEWKPDNN